jgi:IclR family transcriptional regulator, acetate operon repressor
LTGGAEHADAPAGGSPPLPSRAGVGAVDNALRLLSLYSERDVLGVSEAARLLGVGRSTAHRLFTTLRAHGFVTQDSTRAYRPGPALRGLGAAVTGAADLRSRCRPYLEVLCDELGETVNLVTLRGREAVFIYSVESRRPLRVGGREGIVLPAHAVSAGKALLAQLTPAEVEELYPEEHLPALTERTIVERAALLESLDVIRSLGYALNVGESERGITAVACVVAGRPRGEGLAVAVSAPSSRVRDDDDLMAVAAAVRACAEHLSYGLAVGP